MGNNPVSCCWNSRNSEESAGEKDKENKKDNTKNSSKGKAPKLRKNKINEDEDEDDEDEQIPQSFPSPEKKRIETRENNITNISNINPNADDTQNDINPEADISVSYMDNSDLTEGDEIKFKNNNKEITPPKLHNSKLGMGTTNSSINKPSINKNNKVYLRIEIESLDLRCNNLDDYGTTIKPFIELFIENISAKQIRISDDQFNKDNSISVNESLNNSMNHNTSMNKNNSMLKHSVLSHIGEIRDFKEKNYTFTFSENYKLSDNQTFGVIFISIKNENGNFTSDITPNITIGTALIPMRSLINKYFNSEFSGYVEIFSKETQLVGLIKVNIKVSDKNLEGEDEFNLKMNLAKKSYNQLDNNILSDLDNNLPEQFDNYDPTKIYQENRFLHYEHLEENSIDKYFVSNYSYKESHVKEVKSFNYEFFNPDKVNDYNSFNLSDIKSEDLTAMYNKSFNGKNFFLLHLFLISLNKICVGTETEIGFEYVHNNLFSKFKNFNSGDNNQKEKEVNLNNFFYNIPKFCSFNTYIIKNYFKFIYYYLRYYRNHKNPKIRYNMYFDESLLILKVAETIKTLNDKVKKEYSTEGYKLESISTIILGFNILTELSTVNKEISVFTSKEEQVKRSSEDFTKVYKNCIEILQKRYSFLRPIEVFPNNSQVLSFITRIFRKVLQMIFSPAKEVKKLESIAKTIGVHPKDLINTIRKIVIEDHDGVFITSLKIILSKFYHFPEIHLNVNLILIALTSNLKSNEEILLLTAADKIDFTSLKDNFQIFRGKFYGICRLINIAHLNILKNFILFDINNSNSTSNIEILGKLVVYCFRSFFKLTNTYKNRYVDFQKKKQTEIEIQELITLIGVNLTKNKKIVKLLLDSEFFDDLIEYIIILATGYGEEEEDGEMTGVSVDFVSKVLEKKKKKNLDESFKKLLEKLIKQSIGIVMNVYKTGDHEIIENFDRKLADRDITSWGDVFEELKSVFETYGLNMNNIHNEIEVLSKHIVVVPEE